MAKATRQLHISEDVFSGYNHTVRRHGGGDPGQFSNNAVILTGEGRTAGGTEVVEVKKGGPGDSLLVYTLR